MFKKEAESIIDNAVSENRLLYSELTEYEQRVLVANLLLNSEQGLADADNNYIIQTAIADVIANNADFRSIEHLKSSIQTVFIAGIPNEYEAHYAFEIQNQLSDKWDRENSKPNEHYEHDVMQRTRDIQDAQKRISFTY